MKDELEERKLFASMALLPTSLNALNSTLKKMVTSSNSTTTPTMNPVDGTSRFVHAEDPTKSFQKKSIAKLSELIQVNKDILKKNMGNWSKGLGNLLMAGGLLGFLLTGKGEFLTSMVKGFEKMFILPIAKMIDKVVSKLAKSILEHGASTAAKMAKAVKALLPKAGTIKESEKIAASVSKAIKKGFKDVGGVVNDGKIVDKFGKAIPSKKIIEKAPQLVEKLGGRLNSAGKLIDKTGNFTTFEKLLKESTKVVEQEGSKLAGKGAVKVGEKFGIKAMMKSGGKLGLKALAKIPFLGIILGPVLGIWFAIERYKKGDYIGALGEFASGIATMIPGAGTFISLGIDALLLLRDFKSPEAIQKQNNDVAGKFSKSFLESMPVIGTVLHYQNMMKLWKTDKKGAWKEASLAFGSLIPGFAQIEGIVNYFSDNKDVAPTEVPPTSASGDVFAGGISGGKGASREFGGPVAQPSSKLLPQGTSDFVETTQVLNSNTNKMKNRYKFNASWDSLIDSETKNSPISSDVIRSMIMQESGGDPKKENPISHAKGLGQFMDYTAKDQIPGWFGPKDSFNPEKSIRGMVRYMEDLYRHAGGDKNPNAIFKAMYDYHGHGEAKEGDVTSGNYVHEIASRMGVSAPTGMMTSNRRYQNEDKTDIPYNFGTGFGGSVASNTQSLAANSSTINNTQAIPSKELENKLDTINAPSVSRPNEDMALLIDTIKEGYITLQKAIENMKISQNTTYKAGSAG